MIRFRCKCCNFQLERPDSDEKTTLSCPECREICHVPAKDREDRYEREDENERDEPPRRGSRVRDHDEGEGDDRPRRGGQFRCPFCGTNETPTVSRRISTGGWITFAVLLIMCFPLFWIGLLIKEDFSTCYDCRAPLT